MMMGISRNPRGRVVGDEEDENEGHKRMENSKLVPLEQMSERRYEQLCLVNGLK